MEAVSIDRCTFVVATVGHVEALALAARRLDTERLVRVDGGHDPRALDNGVIVIFTRDAEIDVLEFLEILIFRCLDNIEHRS